MNLPFLYSEKDAEAFMDDLLDTPDGWHRFVSDHTAWGFDAHGMAGMIRDRSRGRYAPTPEHVIAMASSQAPRETARHQEAA